MNLAISISALIIGSLALLIGSIALIMIIARDRATHTVQMVPMDDEINRANEEYLKSQEGSWATSEAAINKDQKLYNEEMEDEMPEFSLTDDDKEIFSL